MKDLIHSSCVVHFSEGEEVWLIRLLLTTAD